MSRWVIAVAARVAGWWVVRQEREIVRSGIPLTASQQSQAIAMGVREPERVRILLFREFPAGLPWWLGWAAPLVRRAARGTVGMALGYGVLLRRDLAEDAGLLRHELVHVAQYERLGRGGFLRAYLMECWAAGYPHGALEAEARHKASSLPRS